MFTPASVPGSRMARVQRVRVSLAFTQRWLRATSFEVAGNSAVTCCC